MLLFLNSSSSRLDLLGIDGVFFGVFAVADANGLGGIQTGAGDVQLIEQAVPLKGRQGFANGLAKQVAAHPLLREIAL